ncbi:GGDEF domain-containing protein [Chelativorans sp. M5D2P16]|uniref:GGDEF domain-containing protein n=1 Tax=Chelativorans sp. M5D2P16 TaxID=3095678 RepID=UPI002ACA61A9|nr:GGDEF domain-containing protein [Chelativorans sp. M5D2P16]MDZ5698210.1 GGDEF domain-containing protein [Chelativorans sp. M5D2P16]
MRFHKAESAFFLFIALVSGAGVLLFFAYGMVRARALQLAAVGGAADLDTFTHLLLTTGTLLFASIVFGLFFIYPLIRTQAREEGKLRAMTESLSARSELLQHAALTDSLTGTQNRRFFDDALREYLREFGRIRKPVGLMVLDLDHFKQVNDTYGHDVGDQVLREVARCLKDMTRYHDVVARLGGEEFAIVTPNMDFDSLVKLGERIRNAIAAFDVEVGNLRLKVTTSMGLAVWDGKEGAEGFYRRADKMLYEAKRLGRDRVCA